MTVNLKTFSRMGEALLPLAERRAGHCGRSVDALTGKGFKMTEEAAEQMRASAAEHPMSTFDRSIEGSPLYQKFMEKQAAARDAGTKLGRGMRAPD